MNLTGKRAVVFGGTSGIGLATVRQLATAGAKVGAVSRSAEEQAPPAEGVFRRSVDILDREALTAFYKEADPFDLVVNTAVPAGREQGPFPGMDLDGFQATFNKLWGYVNTVHLGLPHFTDQASIVLVSGFPARK